MQDAQLLVNLLKKGKRAGHTLVVSLVNISHMCVYTYRDAYAIHNVTYYLSNIYCGSSPRVFTLVEQITAMYVYIYIFAYRVYANVHI